MNMSLLGVLLVGVLAVCTSLTAVLAYKSGAREARCRRRRSQLRLVVGAGASPQGARDARQQRVRPVPARPAQTSWDPVPVTQWEPPRERDPGWRRSHGHEPSPAA